MKKVKFFAFIMSFAMILTAMPHGIVMAFAADEIIVETEDVIVEEFADDAQAESDIVSDVDGKSADDVVVSSDNEESVVFRNDPQETIQPKRAGEVFVVNSIDELISKIGSNRTIILNDGIYRISETIGIYKYDSNWDPVQISDLQIKAANPGKAEILFDVSTEAVLYLSNCKNVTIQGLILGHDPIGESGCMEGNVIEIYGSDDINIEDCDLYGCGWSALNLGEVGTINVSDCLLRDCTYNAIYYYTEDVSLNMKMNNCVISGNTKKEMLTYSGYDDSEYNRIALIMGDNWGQAGASISCHDCKFFNNMSKLLVSDEVKNSVSFDSGCEFYDNVFDNQSAKQYGVCVNGLTWQVTDSILKIGYPINPSENKVIDNTGTEVLSYSGSSLPWKEVKFDHYDIKDGIKYNEALFNGKTPVPVVVKGDLTGDGVVAMGDVVLAARAVAGNTTLTDKQKAAGDVTGDGIVAMGDVVRIARFVAGSIKEL